MKKQTLKLLLTVICVLAAGICYSCSRQIPQETFLEVLEEPPGEGESAVSEPETDSETAVTISEQVCFYVHICGQVVSPGVYEMEPGDRVFQAVELAGGFAPDADQGALNLALEVEDGMKIVVPSKEEWQEQRQSEVGTEVGIYRSDGTIVDAAGVGAEANQAGVDHVGLNGVAGKVNLNTATQEELMTLRGIGQARAEDIIRYRQERGPFQTIEDIKNVSGIKDAAFQKIKDDITV